MPNFYGKSTEDPNTFLFEFDILCRSYNYVTDAQKLKLFPATLKDSALRWFMGLEEHFTVSWDGVRGDFLKKYQDYYKPKDLSNDIFKMKQHNDESLEEYVGRFLYILQNSKYTNLQEEAIRTVFLRGILDEYMETLNHMETCDVCHKPFTKICELCKKYSRSRIKIEKSIIRDPFSRTSKVVDTNGVTRVELGNFLENFKTYILGTISSQLDMLKVRRKQEEENSVMSILCPKCRRKHSLGECPLENIAVCVNCTENYTTENCPSLLGLQAIYKGSNESSETTYAPKTP